jgi:anti-sigma regulatory factor (Ser/Thr protein kinase)
VGVAVISVSQQVLASKTWPCTARVLHLARHWVRDLLGPVFAQNREAIDRTDTCIGELLVNAYEHSDSRELGGWITLTVLVSSRGVRVEVLDAGSTKSVPRVVADVTSQEAAGSRESGRGMLLVDAFADEWDAYIDEVGRTVWAEIHLPALRSVRSVQPVSG